MSRAAMKVGGFEIRVLGDPNWCVCAGDYEVGPHPSYSLSGARAVIISDIDHSQDEEFTEAIRQYCETEGLTYRKPEWICVEHIF